jgi:hypothetical protein
MANADRNPKDSVLRELNGSRSELGEALDPAKTQPEVPRKKRQLESTVLQLNCWSGGSNTVSSACWDGNRGARLNSSRLRAPRHCTRGQRSQLTTRAATCPLFETGDYLMD